MNRRAVRIAARRTAPVWIAASVAVATLLTGGSAAAAAAATAPPAPHPLSGQGDHLVGQFLGVGHRQQRHRRGEGDRREPGPAWTARASASR